MSERRRRDRVDEDPGGARPASPRRESHAPPEVASIRDLQHRAGNHAVAALLARSGSEAARVQVQRDAPARTPPAGSEADDRSSSTGSMAIADLDLEIPILSFSRGQGGRQRRRDAEAGEEDAGDFLVSLPLSAMDPRLQEASAKGRSFDTVTIKLGPNTTVTLKGVYIAQVMIDERFVSLTLNAASVDFAPGD